MFGAVLEHTAASRTLLATDCRVCLTGAHTKCCNCDGTGNEGKSIRLRIANSARCCNRILPCMQKGNLSGGSGGGSLFAACGSLLYRYCWGPSRRLSIRCYSVMSTGRVRLASEQRMSLDIGNSEIIGRDMCDAPRAAPAPGPSVGAQWGEGNPEVNVAWVLVRWVRSKRVPRLNCRLQEARVAGGTVQTATVS